MVFCFHLQCAACLMETCANLVAGAHLIITHALKRNVIIQSFIAAAGLDS